MEMGRHRSRCRGVQVSSATEGIQPPGVTASRSLGWLGRGTTGMGWYTGAIAGGNGRASPATTAR